MVRRVDPTALLPALAAAAATKKPTRHQRRRRWPLAAAGTMAVAAVMTPRLLRLGATTEEAHRPLPGDQEVRDAQLQGTRAVTINAPPETVWPWIAQIGYYGYGRAGWYAFDLADNDGVPSARTILPSAQHPQVGQLIGEEGFTIVAIDSNRLLVLSYHWPKTKWVVKQGVWPEFGHCSWVFVLEPRGEAATRLIVRTRYRTGPLDLSVVYWPLFFLSDLIMQPAMPRGIRRRAESTPADR